MVTKKSPSRRSFVRKPKTEAIKLKCCSWNIRDSGSCGSSYFMGFLGAAIYYVSQATGVWGGIVGILKAMIWPVFLVHALLKFIGA
jgi:hypothetical protein